MVLSFDLKQHRVKNSFMHQKGLSISFTFPSHPDERVVDLGDVFSSVGPYTSTGRTYCPSPNEMSKASLGLDHNNQTMF